MSLKIFLIFSVLLCAACTSDDDMDDPIVDIDSCLGNPTTPSFIQSCDTLTESQREYICEVTDIGSYSLSNEAKRYANIYCQDLGHTLLYESKIGETIELVLTSKIYSMSRSTFTTAFYCGVDSTTRTAYCMQNERINIGLTSPDNSLKFTFDISSIADTRVETDPGVGDQLRVLRNVNSNFFLYEFSAIIFPGTLSYNTSFSQQHHESIELNGRIFNDVLTNDNNFINFSNYTYYVNPELGIVGFEDDKETLYTLVD